VALAMALLLAGSVGLMIALNPAPQVPAVSASEVVETKRPYVVKLHARWCVVCMMTKASWTAVQEAYAGKLRFVVFDFTTDATAEASRVEAMRLGLGAVFEEYSGETGSVLVLDGASKEVLHALRGHHPLEDYRAAIDAVLAGRR
jgi:thiol-disulfide isomerase/thioredoxin